jgi:biopolymer transport protein ExbD
MLLIFFLVTTSMDSTKGLGRQLPPIDPEEQQELLDVDREKIMTLHLMAGGKLSIEDKPAQIDDTLRKQLRHFIIATGKSHIIELQIDRDADYDSYFRLQNQIVRAYRELRDAAAQKKYKKTFANLNEEQKEEITALLPQRIQETAM